ncbi:dioxygenase [Azoarcus sp. L1K30]|uniref:DODA-type extradiol aromatic ring-opening family dioxygenase n=1 Tax=Azoarcus sp. L1K30 TaxID=2820277 RepID=UPI001B83C75E|nr:class III extradiol ring-cleavage dioxygenase [Azoarcus sp. L1K30]MBR0566391.1 dioxygenase [Azoarcus sp. L1K30]
MSLPTLFISHGSPMFALEPGVLGPRLGALGRALPRPRAVVVMSPHWMTRGLRVLNGVELETIHDFGGFPRELYALRYPAPAAPEVAAEIITVLAHRGIEATADPIRGRDHGAWVPLMHLYPDADIPVIQLSQPAVPAPLALLELGQALHTLRERNILFIASGSLTHNLHDFRAEPDADRSVENYASTFAEWVWGRIHDGALGDLLDYRTRAPFAARAHPTDEHLLPLFAAIGAAGPDWVHSRRIQGGLTHGVLSMDAFMFGLAQDMPLADVFD